MTGPKTNERPGTRAEARYIRMSASKARAVLDLIRGLDVAQAEQVLQFCERDAAIPVRKCLASAVANAEHNDSQLVDELYVSACYADEGPTLKRWRPRARGRATRIRKRTCHIVVIVSRMPEDLLERQRARDEAKPSNRAARRTGQQAQAARRERVARSRAAAAEAAGEHDHDHDHEHEEEVLEDTVLEDGVEVDEVEDAEVDEVEDAEVDEVEDAEVDEVEVEVDEVEVEVEDVDDEVAETDEGESK
jgi:large subunit ribosomal protein L22